MTFIIVANTDPYGTMLLTGGPHTRIGPHAVTPTARCGTALDLFVIVAGNWLTGTCINPLLSIS